MYPYEAIMQPAVPFIDSIPSRALRPGSTINVSGVSPHGAKNFQINLACGPETEGSGRSDIALHFNPRFDTNYVAVNSYARGEWEKEESGSLFFSTGQPFELVFVIEDHGIRVLCNGRDVISVSHRKPVESINTLHIAGDVDINKIQLNPPAPKEMQFPAVPFDYPIDNFMVPGRAIEIIGVPRSFPERFHVDLYSERQGGDVMFHFNPRFNPNRYVVRNSCLGGSWGAEQTDTPFFMFMPDARFKLTIMCEASQFSVLVNDQHFCYFQHRAPFELITNLRVDGDIDIDRVSFL